MWGDVLGILVACVLFAGVCVFIYFFVKSYSMVYRATHPVRRKYDIKSKVPFTYNKFAFTARDGVILSGIEIIPEVAYKGTIIICHYLGGSKDAVVGYADSLICDGYRLVGFDNRNHGESEDGKGVKSPLEADFDAFFKKITSMNITGPFGIMGFSMGATQAIWAMANYKDIKAAIIDSGPLLHVRKYFNYVLDDMKIANWVCRNIFLHIFLYYVGFDRMARECMEMLRKLKGQPVFIIYGSRDTIVPPENSELAYELIKSDKAVLWRVSNSRHLTCKTLVPEEYDRRVTGFFNENLNF